MLNAAATLPLASHAAHAAHAALTVIGTWQVVARASAHGTDATQLAALALATLACIVAFRVPWIAAAGYVALAYAVPRYDTQFDALLASGTLGWISLIGFAGWLQWSWRGLERPDWARPLPWLAAALFAWIALSWLGTQPIGEDHVAFRRHDPAQFLHAGVLCLIAATTLRTRLATWTMTSILCAAVATRLLTQFGSTLYLDGDAPLLAAMALPPAITASLAVRAPFARAWFAACAVSAIAVIALAHNRAAGIGATVAVLLLIMRAGRRFVAALVVALACLGVVAMLSPLGRYAERYSVMWNPDASHATASLDRATVAARLEIWRATWDMVLDHPWLGVGPGNAPRAIAQYDQRHARYATHNSVLNLLAEAGVPGALLYVALFVAVLIALERTARRAQVNARASPNEQASDAWQRPAAIMLQASLAAFLAAGMFVSRHDMVLSYMMLGWAIAVCGAAAIRPLPDRPGSPQPPAIP